MNAQVMLKENAARAADVAKAAGATAGVLAETLEKKSEFIVEAIEKQSDVVMAALESKAGPIAKAIEKQSDVVVAALGSRAGPIAKAVEAKAEVVSEALEEAFEKARKEATASFKGFRFGQREVVLLGIAAGVLAVVVISRRIDRKAAAERLRAAGTRVGESAQGLGAKVSPAMAAVTSKAGELAGQVKEGVSTRAGSIIDQLLPSNGRHGGVDELATEYPVPSVPPAEEGRAQDLEEARQRLAGPESEPPAVVADSEAVVEDAVAEAVSLPTDPNAPAEQAGEVTETTLAPEQSGEIRVSNGMKVVAFDGTDIGRVQETREEVFVLDRPRGADLLVPMDQVARIEGTVVYLRVEVGQVTKMGWEKADTN